MVDPTSRIATTPSIQIRRFGDAGNEGNEVALTFPPFGDISERVIFPITKTHWHGIEDARFVEFNDGGKRTYYATYTAYSGDKICSGVVVQPDFLSISGYYPQRDSRAKHILFPRKLNYVRHDRAAGQMRICDPFIRTI